MHYLEGSEVGQEQNAIDMEGRALINLYYDLL